MTRPVLLTVLCIITISAILIAGCVTPPAGTKSSSTPGSSGVTTAPSVVTTTLPLYVTEVTPFVTNDSSSDRTQTSRLYMTPTPYPEDLSCLIYQNTKYFAYDTTAVTFNLKNPPMYISYSVKPTNITVNKVSTSKYGDNAGKTQTITFSDYAPYSWFDITVRDKNTGEILLQDGFGKAKGYGVYTDATLQPLLSSKDLQIEMRGNSITATTSIWVKPLGNFDNPQNKTFAECKYWIRPMNTLRIATATTTPTWTPENQIHQ